MKKTHILSEIRRTAAENGGSPLGTARFEQETGIARRDWYGKHWARWGDALREAGFEPNTLQGAYSDEFVLDRFIDLTEELGRVPVSGDLRIRAKSDPGFPSHNVFERVGRKRERIAKAIARCLETERDHVAEVLRAAIPAAEPSGTERSDSRPETGYVYLMKSGRYYKIGYSNAPGRREYELALQLPEEVTQVHAIRTDDPQGIEEYWHRRFAARRKGGEWFALTAEDVKAFKRRRTM